MASIETLVLQDGKKRYRVWWRDPSGRVCAKRFPKYDAARSFLRDVEVDKARGSYVDPSKGKIIVADAWERFEAGPLRSYKESTQASQQFHFRTYVLPALGTRRINSIEKEDVERLMHDMEEKAQASGRKLKAGGYGSREKAAETTGAQTQSVASCQEPTSAWPAFRRVVTSPTASDGKRLPGSPRSCGAPTAVRSKGHAAMCRVRF